MEVENEMGVIVRFAETCADAGWAIDRIGPKFPDATIRHIETGETFTVEFEYEAKNFISHGHDPRECDAIICWNNNWRTCPMTVIGLSDPDWKTTRIVRLDVKDSEILHLKIDNARLRSRIKKMQERMIRHSENNTVVMDRTADYRPTITYEEYAALNAARNGQGPMSAGELLKTYNISHSTAYQWQGDYRESIGLDRRTGRKQERTAA